MPRKKETWDKEHESKSRLTVMTVEIQSLDWPHRSTTPDPRHPEAPGASERLPIKTSTMPDDTIR